MPFRDTHHLSGAAVKMAEERGCSLFDLMPEDLRTIHPLFADDVAEVLSAQALFRSPHRAITHTSFAG